LRPERRGGRAAGKTITINFEVESTDAKHALMLKNRVLNHSTKPAASPDLMITGTSSAIVAALMSGKLDEAIAQGTGRCGAKGGRRRSVSCWP
jgi:alkyl sulfatase BDS1-like metallo-beta-lactamase superfamily hydrolase